MATVGSTQELSTSTRENKRILDRPADNIRFDWWFTFLSGFIIFGLFIDGWAHNHGQVDTSFFTPWHMILYTAYGISGLLLVVTHFRNVGKGYSWSNALPNGYMLSLLGVLIFAVSGFVDMLWHNAFGIEENLEALISPSHLSLAVGGFLMMTGPIRAFWWRSTSENTWRGLLPVILAFTYITSIFTFFMAFVSVTGYLRPLLGERPTSTFSYDIDGIMSILTHISILMGVALLMVRRWKLPFGSLTFIFTINAVLMNWIHINYNEEFLFAVSTAIAGFVGDLLLARIVYQSTNGLRLFAFLVPLVYSLGTLAVLQYIGTSVIGTGGLWWAIHMWLGVPFIAGFIGIFLSFLVVPPAIPEPKA